VLLPTQQQLVRNVKVLVVVDLKAEVFIFILNSAFLSCYVTNSSS
jgi:hypothetical protein